MSLKSRLLAPFSPTAKYRESGMTIIEILIVIALLGTIMTIVMTNVLSKSDEAKADLALVQMQKLSEGLTLYKNDNNLLPSTEEGLAALAVKPDSAKHWRGPYVEAEKLKDPWNNEIRYELEGANKFRLISSGMDGDAGTDDDITFPLAKSDKGPETIELQVPVESK